MSSDLPDHLLLPRAAGDFMPHRLPMRLVDRLLAAADGCGTVSVRLADGCPLLAPDGTLEGVALVELMAQGYAAVQGYTDQCAGHPPGRGFLVGIRRAQLPGKARAGEELTVEVHTVARIEAFALIEGEVRRGAEVLASAALKLWLPGAAA